MSVLEVPALSDYHVHLRQGPQMALYAARSAQHSGRVLAMPNTTPPLATGFEAADYAAAAARHASGCEVLAAVKLLPTTTTADVLATSGMPQVPAFKLYPAGVTTHSGDGIGRDVLADPGAAGHAWFADLLGAMERADKVLCLHGEMPGQDDPFEREPDFLPFVDWVLATFPRLRVVVEHASTAAAVRLVADRSDRGKRVAATITAHHLVIHVGHVLGSAGSDGLGYGDGKIHPHLFCWPVAKRPADRESLLWAATSGMPCFFLGSDSAPHAVAAKETACGCAGVYSAPVLPEVLAGVFASRDALDRLPAFVAHSGDQFYGRPPTGRTIRLRPGRWPVFDTVDGVVPFLAGRTLDWGQV